ncbi:hypothetical protein AAY473_016232 [Plecturocebus cupreus]
MLQTTLLTLSLVLILFQQPPVSITIQMGKPDAQSHSSPLLSFIPLPKYHHTTVSEVQLVSDIIPISLELKQSSWYFRCQNLATFVRFEFLQLTYMTGRKKGLALLPSWSAVLVSDTEMDVELALEVNTATPVALAQMGQPMRSGGMAEILYLVYLVEKLTLSFRVLQGVVLGFFSKWYENGAQQGAQGRAEKEVEGKIGSLYIAQVSLKLLTSSTAPTSDSQSARIDIEEESKQRLQNLQPRS